MTSPPYWGLRDYGVAGQIGLEGHPREYINKLVAVLGALRRVLKPGGSLYLNLGDTYCSTKGSCFNAGGGQESLSQVAYKRLTGRANPNRMVRADGRWLQAKQLLMIPARVAIGLQEEGWILRNDIVWYKPNGLPTSVKDRLANKYEHVFHFVKSRRYFYDLDAIRVPQTTLAGAVPTGRSRNHQIYDPGDGHRSTALGTRSQGGMVEGARLQRSRGALRLLRSDGKNPGDVVTDEEANAGGNNKPPYKHNNPHFARLLHGVAEAGHPNGKNPGDVVAARNKTASLGKIGSMRNPPEPSENGAFHRLGKNPGDLVELDGQLYPIGQDPAYRYGSRSRKWNRPAQATECDSFARWKATRPRTINARGKNPGDTCVGNDDILEFWKALLLQAYRLIGVSGPKRFSGKHDLLDENAAGPRALLNSGRARNSGYWIIDNLEVSSELKQALKNWWHDHSSHSLGPNPGDFWRISTRPFPEAHFAVYPEDLCARPIQSSCPAEVCSRCGMPRQKCDVRRNPTESWRSELVPSEEREEWRAAASARQMPMGGVVNNWPGGHVGLSKQRTSAQHRWKTCGCDVSFEPGIVFDPFAGAGTTLVVAKKLGRRWLGSEINRRFVKMAERRLGQVSR